MICPNCRHGGDLNALPACRRQDGESGKGTQVSCGLEDCATCKDIREIHEEPKVRTFDSGATRDAEDGKLDFEAYLSPAVLLRYAQYMQDHQTRSDGTHREGDDWQRGMPKDVYMKSLLRHLMDAWLIHRHIDAAREDIETALCGVIFNAMGYLFNELEGLE